ncbi:MAG: hypothetical protein J5646_06275 [Bacteroidales bacterium]|nr:hypothetical protein [Bacteroidales bacterium]
MKKGIIIFVAALLSFSTAFAQEEKPSKFKLYGFIRNYMVADSRAVNAGTEDLYFYMPKGHDYKNVNMANQFDANDGFNWRFVSLTTRLGLDVSGYKWGTMGVSGKVEADFYYLSGSVPTLRLRQAFMKLNWDNNPVSLTIGQSWHPMAADMPHMNNLETGAPFNPFNRSPQLTADVKLNDKFTLTASMLYLNHYLPTGPAGKSKDYYKYGLPEFYLGVAYKSGKFVGKLGLDMVNMRPYRTMNATWVNAPNAVVEVKGMLHTFSPFVFVQYTNGLFQLRAKSILAQSGEHMNLLSGYGIASFDQASATITYTPMQDWASFVSFQYGKKFQVMGMLGYMKQLGTTKDLVSNPSGDANLWINTAADTKIQQAFRATPTVAWNLGKFTVSLEYNLTAAEFGSGTRNARGMYTGDKEWILNHRFICMTKFNF